MSKVLCPGLYQRLKDVFGEVEISAEGEPYREVVLNVLGERRRETVTTGEYYRVACPFCGESRKRLYINHNYVNRPGMAICFNETACLSGPQNHVNRESLRKIILEYQDPSRFVVFNPPTISEDDGTLREVGYPGNGRLLELVSEEHPAVRYLRSRGFDPVELSKVYGVGLVERAGDANLVGRILVPIHMDGKMVGWQGRYPDDLDWKATGIRKYWNLPGMKKSRMLYGYDRARSYQFCVVVEGVTDVWRIGPPAVCILGSSLNYNQRRLICATWRTVFVMLDPDALDKSRVAVQELGDQLKGVGGRVIHIVLPGGKDPAEFDRKSLQQIILDAARSAGVSLGV